MIRKTVMGAVWLLTAAALYFFENNTGTRIVLAGSLILLLCLRFFRLPANEKKAVSPDKNRIRSQITEQTSDETGPGDVREYIPGDSFRKIHWKLYAKTDRLFIRGDEHEKTAGESALQESIPEGENEGESRKKPRLRFWILSAVIFLSLALLLLVPGFRNSAAALCNRLFDWSESINAYTYERFTAPDGQSILPALLLLLSAGCGWITLLILSGKRTLTLMTAALLAGFQAYFGVSFPAWVNVILFGGMGFLLFVRAAGARGILYCAGVLLCVSLLVFLLWPGVDINTETASERVRDLFSQAARRIAGAVYEAPAEGLETRHVNTQSLLPGENEAQTDKTYRLVTVEEEQISIPHWINYLKIVLLLLLAIAVILLPFAPFVIMNNRRKKALEARRIFDSEDVSEAVAAMFRHVTAWLAATQHDGGNRLYREWTSPLAEQFSEEYAARWARCEALFEEAAYSEHTMNEEARSEVRSLLDETESMLYDQADWKQRFRLKYVEGLYA